MADTKHPSEGEPKAQVIRLALEWAQCAARPKVIEVNAGAVRTRRPRDWRTLDAGQVAAEVVYAPDSPEEP